MNITIGNYVLHGADNIDPLDSRGIVWQWEAPNPRATYIVSCDPSYGIAGWDRSLRTEDDVKTDNCAIQVIRCGGHGHPDVQVAEYAAPIDAEDAAAIVNFMGRMYGGADEEGQALAIIEVQPGPGLLTQRELMNRFGYINLFQWQHLDQMQLKPTTAYGWYSSRQSRQMLWIRGTRHINQSKIVLNSPFLVEEMTDLQQDNFLSFTSRAQWGGHDDRMVALLMGIWAANEWSFENIPEEQAKPVDSSQAWGQASAMTYEELMSDWDARTSDLIG